MTKVIKKAIVYRMVLPSHTCPYGIKTNHLLRKHGYTIEDHILKTRAEVDDFKSKHNVQTTPQTFINGVRIGGYTDLLKHFGYRVLEKGETTYRPIIAIFSVALLLALSVDYLCGNLHNLKTIIPHFVSVSMILLSLMKLRDVESFSTMFINYDLLAKRWVPYSYVYPYAELTAGLLMLTKLVPFISIPMAIFISSIGGCSVFKAVYIDKRELKCACVGGDTNVPLGFISFTENIMMFGMAVWMLYQCIPVKFYL
ncbi:MAG: glutaredoxin [Legionellales bacterium]|nr:glutaredoxin [Legionellales bacterium]